MLWEALPAAVMDRAVGLHQACLRCDRTATALSKSPHSGAPVIAHSSLPHNSS